jgi:hypothetical protein
VVQISRALVRGTPHAGLLVNAAVIVAFLLAGYSAALLLMRRRLRA